MSDHLQEYRCPPFQSLFFRSESMRHKRRRRLRRRRAISVLPTGVCTAVLLVFSAHFHKKSVFGSFSHAFSNQQQQQLFHARKPLWKLSRGKPRKNDTNRFKGLFSLVLDIDNANFLSSGSIRYPPMISVPCFTSNPKRAILTEIIQPPNVDELYQWYQDVLKEPNADPSWGVLWPSALSLTNYLMDNPDKVQNESLLELGAGLGICGLTGAALGAKDVLLTDREPYALHCAMATASCNGLDKKVVVKASLLDWSDHRPKPHLDSYSATLILASDVLYDPQQIHALAKTIDKFMDPHTGGTLLLTDPLQERFVGARDLLQKALTRTVKQWEILELPPLEKPPWNGTTMDAMDHQERNEEAIVLIQCRVGPKVEQLVAIAND